jgi:hypothetical protein
VTAEVTAARTWIVPRVIPPNLWATAANRFSPCCPPWKCNAPTITAPGARADGRPRTSTWWAERASHRNARGLHAQKERSEGGKVNESAGQKLWKRRAKSAKLDDRDHFQQNAKSSVASLRGLIGSSRNIDRHHSGMLIGFIGIPTFHSLDKDTINRSGSAALNVINKQTQPRSNSDRLPYSMDRPFDKVYEFLVDPRDESRQRPTVMGVVLEIDRFSTGHFCCDDCRRLRLSAIKKFKPMADFEWDWPTKVEREVIERALTPDFIHEARNFVLVGQNSLGKTMTAQNICHLAVLAGCSVLFRTAAAIVEDLRHEILRVAASRWLSRIRAGYRGSPPQSRSRHLHRIPSAQNAALRREEGHRARIPSGERSEKNRFRRSLTNKRSTESKTMREP